MVKTPPGRAIRAVPVLLPALRREAGNLSQREFAKLLKWNLGKVVRLESGGQKLTINDLMYMAEVLKQDPVRLFERFVDWSRIGRRHASSEDYDQQQD